MSGGQGGQSTTPTRLQAIDVQQSAYAQAMKLVYGRMRASGTLIWYGNFTATPYTSSQQGGKGGGGGSGSTSYSYSASVQLALCEGPMTGSIGTVWADKAVHALSDYSASVGTGAGGQAPWAYLTSNFPSQADGYDHTAWVGIPNMALGSSAAMPNLTFEVFGLASNAAAPLNGDAEPYNVINDYCTDPNHGASFPYLASLTGANSYQQYCMAMGFFISPMEDTQRTASSFLQDILDITNSEAVWSVNQMKIIPRADAAVSGNGATFTPSLTPIYSFTDDDYIADANEEPVTMTRQPVDQAFNSLSIEYLDRAQAYNTAVATHQDDQDIAVNGVRMAQTATYHQITTPSVARTVAQLLVNKQLFYLNQFQFKVRGDYCLLEPMDPIALTDTNLGLSNTVCRVVEINEDENFNLTITAEELPVGPATGALYNLGSPSGYAANTNQAPGSVATPFIFAGPPQLVQVGGGYEVWIAVGASAPSTWGGCQVWMSVDGVDYVQVGVIHGQANYGTVSANWASGTDPDTTNALQVQLLNTSMYLGTGASLPSADLMRQLAFVDGEIVCSSYCIANGSGAYTMTSTGLTGGTKYVRRGLYGSTIGLHNSGTHYVRLDNAIFRMPIDPGFLGQTLHFKFPSFNQMLGGLESLASATDYTYTPSNMQVLNATIQNAVTCTGTAVAQGLNFGKPTGSNAWDSNVNSVKAFQGGCYVSARVNLRGTTAPVLSLGFTTTANLTGQAGINFGLEVNGTTSYIANESGTNTTLTPVPATGDVIALVYDGRIMRYYVNGVLQRAVAAPGLLLYATCAINQVGSVLENIEFGAQQGSQLTGGNFLNTWPWQVGASFPLGNWVAVNTNTGGANAIILGDGSALGAPLGPFGSTEVLWKSTGGTGGSGNVGINDTLDLSGLDPNKTYRMSLWVRYSGAAGAAVLWFGPDGSGNIKNLSPGTADTNPAWVTGNISNVTLDKWYLLVGVIHGQSYTGANTGISGLYDPATGAVVTAFNGFANGANVSGGGVDFKFASGSVVGTTLKAYAQNCTSASNLEFWSRPRFEEMNGQEQPLSMLLWPGVVDPTQTPGNMPSPSPRLGVLPKGNVVPMVQNATFTYTSTSSSLQWSWTGYTIYRPDGSSFAMSSGSQNITGLSFSSTYYSYPYSAESAPSTMAFATGAGSAGTPAIAYLSTVIYADLAIALASASLMGNIFQGKLTGATPASGTGGGGGGGGGYGCPHPDQWMVTADGRKRAGRLMVGDELVTPMGFAPIVRITRPVHHEWLSVECDNGERVTVTLDHRFVAPDGEQIRGRDLRIGQVLAAGGKKHLEVVALRLRREDIEAVSIELPEPHLYRVTEFGPLSHNLKP